ncbi:MAG TPA: SIMPL domain-containing protein [Jatrophihabitans sp.]|nr:SIMPL domain-containing protein [Jatrophihabitans sp.]
MPVEITVSEIAEEFHRPERAVLSVMVGFDGPDKAVVRERTVAVADELATGVAELLDEYRGPITRYSRSGLATWTDRVWQGKGEQQAPLHQASDRFSVTFADFTLLSDWVDRYAAIEGVSIGEVHWRLTRRRADEVAAAVRTAAVRAALAKAQAYADSLELGPVRLVSLADRGMLAGDGRPIPMREAVLAIGSGGTPAVLPEDVRVAAGVDARFSAGD